MAHYQNSDLTVAGSLFLGSAKVEVAGSVGGSFVNVGIAREVSVVEEIEFFDIQADNAPDPIEGVAKQEVVLSFTMLEFVLPTWDEIRGGIDTGIVNTAGTVISGTSTMTVDRLSTGGLQDITRKCFRLTNTKMASGTTVETVIVAYSTSIESGLNMAFASDTATDPILPLPFSVRGKLDVARTEGDQLFIIETEMATS